MFEDNASHKRRRRDDMSEAGEHDPSVPTLPPAENPQHGMRVLYGLSRLKHEGILCDITLIAEDVRFEVHKVILVACSDYFRSMFTSGMRESNQSEIELKGVSSKGLEKTLEIIYTSTTTLEGDDIFDVIAAATHLQATPVIEFCERNFLSGMTTQNFYDFISTARLYNMDSVLKQIDQFIGENILQIARDNTLPLLTYDQIEACFQSSALQLREIDIFMVAWEWLRQDPTNTHEEYVIPLISLIRFPLISPTDLVTKVQTIKLMMSMAELRQMVLAALNYHVMPHRQPLHQHIDSQLRCCRKQLVSIGGREIHPHPGLHDEVYVYTSVGDSDFGTTMMAAPCRRHLATLPNALSHMQVVVFSNFLYILGGCTTQCAHGESAVNLVLRYDPRFNTWLQVAPLRCKRAYFFAGVVGSKIYAVGGKFREGSLASNEAYNPETNTWDLIPSLVAPYHAHAGTVHLHNIYISGGYSSNHFTGDLQRFDTQAQRWDDMSPMLTPRGWHVMCTAPNNKLFVFGGCNLNANQQALPVLQSECYDPATDQWSLIAPLATSHKEAACVVHQDHIYVIGGYNVQTKQGQKMASCYDLYTGIWDTLGTLQESKTGVGYCVLDIPTYNLNDVIS